MSIHGHARCDNCEKILIPQREEGISEDDVIGCGWFIVSWEEGDEDEIEQKKADLCSARCVGVWASVKDAAGAHHLSP